MKREEWKRIFIALPLEKRFLKSFEDYRDGMGRATPYLRWAPVANLHLTVLFIGDVSAGEALFVSQAVQGVCDKTRTFLLDFDKIIYAPPNRPSSMVWAVFQRSNDFEVFCANICGSIQTLAADKPESFPDFGCGSIKEPIPHVTLARFKPDVGVQKLVPLGRAFSEKESMQVGECLLMESKLTPAGPTYKIVSAHDFAQSL